MNFNIKNSTKYWLDGSSRDFKAAKFLFKKRLYPQCLFFCHLSLEKILKALVTQKTKEPSPFVHDLRRLAQIAGLDLSEDKLKILDKLFSFNIAGRYPEEKLEFYKKYNNKKNAEVYLKLTDSLLIWLRKEFLKK